MSKTIQTLVFGFMAAIALAIVFVKAGTTGESGGKQTADILNAGGQALAQVTSALEGNAA